VIFPRQGLVAFAPVKVRHIDGTQGAGLVARKWEDWQADACFIDKGGFGSSWIDNLRRLGREPIGIAFSGRAADRRHENERTEMTSRRSTGSAGAAPCRPRGARS
jgi:hypothetical protein